MRIDEDEENAMVPSGATSAAKLSVSKSRKEMQIEITDNDPEDDKPADRTDPTNDQSPLKQSL